ncbi:MAG: flippase-like domain-containing protein [Bacilli bacterium]|nr:flippase-like domain-containing protein [Bacilli bacterium]
MPNDSSGSLTPEKKKKSGWKYFIYILIVLIATAVSLITSLWGDNFNQVVDAFRGAKWQWFLLIIGLVLMSYVFEGLILLVFCRLYTRSYKLHQGVATSMIGQFYSDLTPGASGGQAMQIYTLKSQGIQVSNAASIMVMSFILYQSTLIGFDIVALCFEWHTVMEITVNIDAVGWHLPMWPLVILGFLLNISVIFLLLAMSYSHHFHNFILRYVIGFLGKIRIIKKPDEVRESLRVQVENFKIELKRLASNIPVIIIQVLFYLMILLLRYSIPYFSAFALNAQGDYFVNGFSWESMFHVCFLTSFHQMVTGLIPLPGSAGVSELFYSYLFASKFLGDGVLNSSQILWRTATFHVMLVISGFVAAFYRSRPKESIHYANRKTFVDLQLETFDERKKSADTLFETRSLSRKAIQRRMNDEAPLDLNDDEPYSPMKVERVKPKKEKRPKKEKPAKPKKKKKDSSRWEEWDI